MEITTIKRGQAGCVNRVLVISDSSTVSRLFFKKTSEFIDELSWIDVLNLPTYLGDEEMVMLNKKCLSDSKINDYVQKVYEINKNSYIVIVNLPRNDDYKDLCLWPNVKGVFFEGIDEHCLKRGMVSISNGNVWFSREYANHIVKLTRTLDVVFSPEKPEFSKAELRVIKELRNGYSNEEIALALHKSKNTIKSHLQKIYKKIGVKSRLEAAAWIKLNIKE